MGINGETGILGILGYPVRYSLSPVMHNAALQHLGQNLLYVAFPVATADLAAAIAGFGVAESLVGLNVTIPHKEQILPYLSAVDERANQVGAVNTIRRQGRGWVGTNTDVAGFLAPLAGRVPPPNVTVLGCGGAARAVVVGCREWGCGQIRVIGRNPQKLAAFQRAFPGVRTRDWAELPQILPETNLLVNTTPVGMGAPGQTPLTPGEVDLLPRGATVYDLIYKPRPTPLLRLAAARGLGTLDGLSMLLHQGAIALEYWLGVPAPVDVMYHALTEQLAGKDAV
ncbi:MAG: shikimate dehydrogenase [Oscillatoriales cyanobacterium SM2_2_1]|nr:shikimate dehydrogenase [Oscillatoriales cyanobacterium SM2_2_1]